MDRQGPTTSSCTFKWRLLRAGPLLLDGGSMFGVVPRVVWSKSVPTDAHGRMTVAHNCLLLERHESSPSEIKGPKRILIEAGSGDKFDAKNRAIFGLGDETIESAVKSQGVQPGDIDACIVSHLHFDHAGGLTRLAREGEKPDWVDEKNGMNVCRTFPNAPVFIQQREVDDAQNNRSHMTRTYLRENLEPLRPMLKPIDAPLAFPEDALLTRNQLPAGNVAQRAVEILPGVFVFRIPGHTWGQQAILFNDDGGRAIVFTADLMPTIHHIGAAYNMAYDVAPYVSTLTRKWFLTEAAVNNWLLVLDHEPGNPLQRVREDGKGWFVLKEET